MGDQRRPSVKPALNRRLLDNAKKNLPINTREQNKTKNSTQNKVTQRNSKSRVLEYVKKYLNLDF
jgi:hypothetical protein